MVKAWESPYVAFSDNPIYFVDPSGLEGVGPGDDECEFDQVSEQVLVQNQDGENSISITHDILTTEGNTYEIGSIEVIRPDGSKTSMSYDNGVWTTTETSASGQSYENGAVTSKASEYSYKGVPDYIRIPGSLTSISSVGTNVEISNLSATMDIVQTGLDVVGLIPVVGDVCDGVNGVISLCRGNYLDAGLSFGAMITVIGSLSTGLKYGKKTENLAPIVIGENMTRVKKYAKAVGADYYKPWRNTIIPKSKSLERNANWIKRAKKEGRTIIDIGPDFERRLTHSPSDWYGIERMNSKDYGQYQRVWERYSRTEGGVPGFDF